LPDEARLPLVDITLPALKQLSAEQYAKFRQNIEVLIKADRKIELFEYTVRTLLLGNLDVHFGRVKPAAIRYRRLEQLLPSLVRVLSTLAYAGQKTAADVKRAFDKGMVEVGRSGAPLAKSDCALSSFDVALKALAEAAPKLKKQTLAACAACVAADNEVTSRERQLLRAVAAVLGVPTPPVAA
jgi:hypothetical protein